MLRRDFLRRTSIALAGGLIVGDAAMEMFERLTHRKVWTGAVFPADIGNGWMRYTDQHGRYWATVKTTYTPIATFSWSLIRG